jgi:hypothetical protein
LGKTPTNKTKTMSVSSDQKIKKWSQGEVHPETGLIFWGSNKKAKSGERWLTAEQFAVYKEKNRANRRAYYAKNRQKQIEASNKWSSANRDRVLLNGKKYYQENKEKRLEYLKGWRSRNIDKISQLSKNWRANNKERASLISKEWRAKNADKVREDKRLYLKNRTASDPIFAMKRRLSRRLHLAISSNGYKKTSKMRDMIGCDWADLIKHIESKFTDGMSWENRNLWHVDHIIPLSSAKSFEELAGLNHYSNLQPLWAIDNIKKGDKITAEKQTNEL